jgi:hypothetical protein
LSQTIPIAAAVAVVVLAGIAYTTTQSSKDPFSDTSVLAKPVAGSTANKSSDLDTGADEGTSLDTQLESVNAAESAADAANSELTELSENSAEDSVENGASLSVGAGNAVVTPVSEAIEFARGVAVDYTDDATLIDQAKALADDPALLVAVQDEFTTETDPARLDRLRLLLGQLDDPSLVGVAETMAFSGNDASAAAGLDLLRDISAKVPEARSVALDVMSSTQDAELLVRATQVMASGKSDDANVVQRVVTSMSSLVQHPDATVRRAGYATLARWANGPSVTPTLLQGLTDEDPAVRKSTAYGLVGYPHADSAVMEALLQTAENGTDTQRARKGAVLALKGMPLDDVQRQRLLSAESQLQ